MSSPYDASYQLEPKSGYDSTILQGSTALITGGSSGIGEAIAKAFVQAGVYVVIGDCDTEDGTRVCAQLGADHCTFVQTEVSSWRSQANLFREALRNSPSGRLDIVIANAGHSGRDPIYWNDTSCEEPPEPDLTILNSCLVGSIYTLKLALHYMHRQSKESGHDRCIMLMSSIAAYCEQPGTPLYCASKSGIRSLMKTMRLTLPQGGIRINLIAPWYIRTPAIPKPNQDHLSSVGVSWADVGDAASAALHIASDPNLNGRSVAVVPREVDPRGYMDLRNDDWMPGSLEAQWQETMIMASQRA